jgi:hypothetical protein
MGVQYEVTAITGKYTDKDGNEKNRYTKLGVVIEGKNGPMLKLEAIPVGWDGWAYLNEPRAKDDQPQRQGRHATAPAPAGDFDDSVPF